MDRRCEEELVFFLTESFERTDLPLSIDLMLPRRDLDFDLDLSAAMCDPTNARSNLWLYFFRELFLRAYEGTDLLSLA